MSNVMCLFFILISLIPVILKCSLIRNLAGHVDPELIECSTQGCTKVKEYIREHRPSNETWCRDPISVWCKKINSSGNMHPNLLYEKAAEVKKRRNIIIKDLKLSQNSESSYLRQASERLNECLTSTNLTSIKRQITKSICLNNAKINLYAWLFKFVYLKPNLKRKQEEVEESLEKMSSEEVCHEMMEANYFPLIDRLYLNRYFNRTVYGEGISSLRQFLKEYSNYLAVSLGFHYLDDLDRFKTLSSEFIEPLAKIHIMMPFSRDLYNDVLMDRVHLRKEATFEQLVSLEPAARASPLPFYPDAVYYSREENALYISPTFFESPLFEKALPAAWNAATMYKIIDAINLNSPESMQKAFLDIFSGTNRSKLNDFLTEMFGQTDLRDSIWNSHSSARAFESALEYYVRKKGESAPLGLFWFLNQHCLPRPAKSSDIVDFHLSTSHMHGFLFLYAHYHRDLTTQCPSLSPFF